MLGIVGKGPLQLGHNVFESSKLVSMCPGLVSGTVLMMGTSCSPNCHLPELEVVMAIITFVTHQIPSVNCM